MGPLDDSLDDGAHSPPFFVREQDRGHSALLRSALRGAAQVAYLWAEDADDGAGTHVVRVYTAEHATPPQEW